MVTDRGSHDAAVPAVLIHIEAVLRRQHITKLLPVGQIPAVKERDSGAQLKAGAHKIIIFSHSAD